LTQRRRRETPTAPADRKDRCLALRPSFGAAPCAGSLTSGAAARDAFALSEIGPPIAGASFSAMMANAVLPLIPKARLIAIAQERQGGDGDRSGPEKFAARHGNRLRAPLCTGTSNGVPNANGQLHPEIACFVLWYDRRPWCE